MTERLVAHVDMDAFFAAVEQRDEPSLQGKPVIIGADPRSGSGRGVVSTCSYEARRFGIKSAMPISQAWQRCPHGVYLKPDMSRYASVSRQIMQIFRDFSPRVEQLSVDEAFIDVSGFERLIGGPQEIGMELKSRVRAETGLSASVGIAPNKSVAKIASDLEKPDGLTIVAAPALPEFLRPLPLRVIWGIGPRVAERLETLKLHTVGDLQDLSLEDMQKLFGSSGDKLYERVRGIDERPVAPSDTVTRRKSISEERTFGTDQDSDEFIETVIFKLCDDISRSMRKENIYGRTLTVKIRLQGFRTHTRSKTVTEAVRSTADLSRLARSLYRDFERGRTPVRLVGVGVSQLTDEQGLQLDMFSRNSDKDEDADAAVDRIISRFGREAVSRAAFLKK
jgi:nucleotidyltransferase/DNA polymerase involved in DNA repair